jgi:hypothetical protein
LNSFDLEGAIGADHALRKRLFECPERPVPEAQCRMAAECLHCIARRYDHPDRIDWFAVLDNVPTTSHPRARSPRLLRIARVPVLVGHRRRHTPMVRDARKVIGEGCSDKLVVANFVCLVYKPDTYFAVPWRRRVGGGPILISMIHEIDLI